MAACRSDAGSGDPIADRRAAYAEGLAREGDHAGAAEMMRQALELAPNWPLGLSRLAAFERDAGQLDAAVSTLRQLTGRDGDGRLGAGLALASLGVEEAPEAAPPSYVEALFDEYAPRFEHSLVERLGYRGPDILMAELAAVRDPLRVDAALDIGCGTGLMGERLRAVTGHLEGIDLSRKMLDRARAKGIYDRLVRGDLLVPPAEWHAAFDLVTAADVLIYLGDLRPVLRVVRRLLRADALFAFTLETHGGPEPFFLTPSLRYAHAGPAVEPALSAAGFVLLSRRDIVVRKDRGADVKGLAVIAAARS